MNSNNEKLSTFLIEASLTYPPEKIYNFFTSKGFVLKEFALKEKKEDSIIYQAIYISTIESMSGLEVIKSDDLYSGGDFKIIELNTNQDYEDVLSKLIEEEKQNNLLTYHINYHDILRTCFMKTYGTEGLEFIDQETLKKQRGVFTYMVKKVGANLLTGKSIMNVSLPIYIFDPRSVLEVFADGYRYAPYYLEKAAESSNLERMKLCTCFCLAIIASQIGVSKPFNPILGETFQAKIGNTEIYVEQTSHHPPIMNYYVKNPNFTGFGYGQMDITAGPNTMTAENKGKFYLKFNDGALYRLYPPKFIITGMMLGKRFINMTESMALEDLSNNLISVINFSKEEKGYFSKLFSSSPKIFPDYISGFIANKSDVTFDEKLKIFKPKSDNLILHKFEGEWSNYLKCDDKLLWKQGDMDLPILEKMSYTLPSDSRLRWDVLLLKNGNEEWAQQAKIRLEELQRADRKSKEKFTKNK